MEKIDIAHKLSSIDQHWSPKIIAELNGQHVKLAKLLGEFVWHHHEHEDELFWVVSGTLRLELRDRVVELEPGQMMVVPQGVEHRPVADQEVHLLLFEPASTLNTGNIKNDMTVGDPEHI